MSNQKGIAHIIVLGSIFLIIVITILIFLGIQSYKALNLTPDQQTQYKNPFNESTQYQNPFETYQNPFDQIQQ